VKTKHRPHSHHAWVITSKKDLLRAPIQWPAGADLVRNIDDSVDIDVRQTSPGLDKEADWLPSPAGTFELPLRIYLSRADGLAEDSLPLPSIRRT
jgi:hypothetical protein